MSATGRSNVRRSDDFYQTPHWCVRAVLPFLPRGPVLDPFAGKGAILRAVSDAGRVPVNLCSGIELDADRAAEGAREGFDLARGDAFEGSWVRVPRACIITNPPYSLAMEAVQRGLVAAPELPKAYLLRLGFLESADRAGFHRKHPCDLYVLSRRPSFAASYKCHPKDGGCGYALLLELDAPRPDLCPQCGRSRWRKTTSDSAAYGWMIWGPNRGGHFEVLEVADAEGES